MASAKVPIIPLPKGLPEARVKLDELLAINHKKYNIVYQGYLANHIAHAVPSVYALGGTPKQVQNFHEFFAKRLEPLPAPKFEINESNWESYIGNLSAYRDLLDFFDRELESKELLEVFHKYIPRLIPGLIGAALHPLILIGYALEFDSKIILSEGLAYASMAYSPLGDIIDTLDTDHTTPDKTAAQLLKTIDDWNPPDYLNMEGTYGAKIAKATAKYGSQLKDLLLKWNFNPSDPSIIYKKTVDLTLASVMAFCGSHRVFAPDFFLAHGLTGNHGIRTILNHLDAKNQQRLLQIGFLAMSALYLTRGPVEFEENFVYRPKPNTPIDIQTQNLDWQGLFNLAKDSTDDHLIKVVRSLHVIKDTIVDENNLKFLPNLCLEGARLVLGTIVVESDWFPPTASNL